MNDETIVSNSATNEEQRSVNEATSDKNKQMVYE